MSAIYAIIEVSNQYKKTDPRLNLEWIGQSRTGEGISINGQMVHEVMIEGEGVHVDQKHLKDDYWNGRDTSKGITRYMSVTVIFESLEGAKSAWSNKEAGIFELADGVLLHFCGMLTQEHRFFREVRAV